MQNATIWRALLGVEKTVIESVEYDEDEQVLVAAVMKRLWSHQLNWLGMPGADSREQGRAAERSSWTHWVPTPPPTRRGYSTSVSPT